MVYCKLSQNGRNIKEVDGFARVSTGSVSPDTEHILC